MCGAELMPKPVGPSPSDLCLMRQARRTLSSTTTARCPSPCIAVCRMSDDTGYCAGCWRTLDEIADWSRADAAAQRAVWQRIAARLRAAYPDHDAGGKA